MTRFKEQKRIDAALDSGRPDELAWVVRYCRGRRSISPNERQRKHWERLEQRAHVALESNLDRHYRGVLGSDVPNDGMYVEFRGESERIVACVFRSDATGKFTVSVGPGEAPEEVVEALVERGKRELGARAGGAA